MDSVQEKKKKRSFDSWDIVIIVLTIFTLAFLLVQINKPSKINYLEDSFDYNSMPENTYDCGDIYLGICFDKTNSMYKCDLFDGDCEDVSFDLVNRIRILDKNNITIYGTTRCLYCQDELSQFGKYNQTIQRMGLFTFCDINKTAGCNDVSAVPTWKKNGTIVHIGYVDLDEVNF